VILLEVLFLCYFSKMHAKASLFYTIYILCIVIVANADSAVEQKAMLRMLFMASAADYMC